MDLAHGLVGRLLDACTVFAQRPVIASHTEAITGSELSGLIGGIQRELETFPPGPVVVAATSGIDLVAAAAGAMSAGRPVIPIDPQVHPAVINERVDGLDVAAMLKSANVSSMVAANLGIPALTTVDVQPAEPRPVHVHPTALVLMAVSSGSSGTPKIRGITHASLATHATAARDRPVAGDRIGLLLGATDAAVRRMMAGIALGSSITCIDARAVSMRAALDAFAQAEVTFAKFVPTYLRRIMAAATPSHRLSSLERLVVGGEALTWQDVATAREKLAPMTTVIHTYGSTEVGRICEYEISPTTPVGEGAVPVGQPRPGVRVWISDDEGRTAANGEVGEVVVDTSQVRAWVEVERLADGRSRHRTGDLGLILPDGNLLLVGRIDRVIKIGGLHVDPCAIEAVLRRDPGVDDAAAVVAHPSKRDIHGVQRPTADTALQILAHVVVRSHEAPSLQALQRLAAEHLPPTSVPHRFVIRSTPLPLLSNGKVDIRSLAIDADLSGSHLDSLEPPP